MIAAAKRSPLRSKVLICLLIASFQSIAAARAGVDEGESLFKKYCSICHSLESGRNKYGPSLSGVVGRKSASMANFEYSAPFRALGVVWTPETLDKYLTAPAKMAPGTRMTFPGLPNPDDRRNLIDFLATVHD